MTVRIGLTGPIGCGKSTVAGWLAERGAVVVDADAVARSVTDAPEVSGRIVERFGTAVLASNGQIDRAALGRIVFQDPGALAELEAIVHPAVRPAILEQVASAERAGAPAVVVEAIKLVEGGLAELCDEVWLVTCDPEVQRERVLARGTEEDDADRRIAAQSGLADRVRPVATRQIDTSQAREATSVAVAAAYEAALGG